MIDNELEFSGWNLLPKEVPFELNGQVGRAGFG
jgi:hypothetical protein